MIIGVVGLIGSGKGTVGDILIKNYGFKSESFAKPLKDAVSKIFNWDRSLLEGDTSGSRTWREQIDEYWTNELGWEVTPRKVLQLMGTEAGRNVFGASLWTSALKDRIDPGYNYVITDTRFVNEISTIKDIGGGFVIRIRRGPDPAWFESAREAKFRKLDVIPEGIHISEWDWINSDLDAVIRNDGTLEDLYKNVSNMISYLKKY